MKLAGLSSEKFGLRKERSAAKRIKIESEPRVEFEVMVTDSRKQVSGCRSKLRSVFGLRGQAQRDTAFARTRRWIDCRTIIARPKAPSPLPLCRRTP